MRRPSLFFALVALLFATGCESIQAPGELTLQTRGALDVLPANVQTVGFVNLDEARASEAFALAGGDEFSFVNMGGEQAARFQDFISATGFNPDVDLNRVYFGVPGGPGPMRTPFFVVYANYDRARLDAYVGDQDDLELERSTYADAPVYITARDGDEMAFALVNDDMIVASSKEGVYDMLDRIESGAEGLSGNNRMMELIRRAAYPDDMWMTTRDLPAATHSSDDNDHPMAQAQRLMDDVVFSVDFKDDGFGVNAFGVPRSGTDAGDVADLVRGSVSMMKIQVESEQALFEVLDQVRVRENGGGVEVRGFVSTDAIRAMKATGDA